MISTAAATLFHRADTKYNQWPHVSRLGHSVSRINLCGLIYGVNNVKAVLEERPDARVESHMTLLTFLRALLAVALKEWVVKGQHIPLPPELSDRSILTQRYEQTVAAGRILTSLVSPRLHEQISQKASDVFFRQDLHPSGTIINSLCGYVVHYMSLCWKHFPIAASQACEPCATIRTRSFLKL